MEERRYNLNFNFMKWRWQNITLDRVKDILLNKYSGLIKHCDENIYEEIKKDIKFDFFTDHKYFRTTKIAYKKDKKIFISICEVQK